MLTTRRKLGYSIREVRQRLPTALNLASIPGGDARWIGGNSPKQNRREEDAKRNTAEDPPKMANPKG